MLCVMNIPCRWVLLGYYRKKEVVGKGLRCCLHPAHFSGKYFVKEVITYPLSKYQLYNTRKHEFMSVITRLYACRKDGTG